MSNEDYNDLKEAIEKLSLSDSALQFEPENSPVLGYGVRIGFLGLLHMDIIRERLERELACPRSRRLVGRNPARAVPRRYRLARLRYRLLRAQRYHAS